MAARLVPRDWYTCLRLDGLTRTRSMVSAPRRQLVEKAAQRLHLLRRQVGIVADVEAVEVDVLDLGILRVLVAQETAQIGLSELVAPAGRAAAVLHPVALQHVDDRVAQG